MRFAARLAKVVLIGYGYLAEFQGSQLPSVINTTTGKFASIRKKEPALAAILLAVVSAILLVPSIRGHDGVGNYVYLMSVLIDGDLNFSNDYAAFDLQQGASYKLSDAPIDKGTHLPANRYGIGSSLLWAPAVIPVHFFLRRISPNLATGTSRPYEWAVAVASAFWGCLGVWLLFMRLRDLFDPLVTWTTVAALLFATPLGFYVWAHGSMSHSVSFFVAVLALLTLERAVIERSPILAGGTGVLAGLLVITRMQDLTWALVIGIALVGFWGAQALPEENPAPGRKAGSLNRWAAGGIFAAGFVLVMLPQMAVWNILYGSWLAGPAPYLNREAGTFSFLPVHFFQALFSGLHGAFAWHPVLLLGVVGLALGLRKRDENRLLWGIAMLGIAGLVLQVYLVSCWSMWWAGASFGNRFFISSYPVLALGIAVVLSVQQKKTPKWVGALLVLLLVIWNAGLLIQYGTEMIPREENPGWVLIIENQFTKVPEWIIDKIESVL